MDKKLLDKEFREISHCGGKCTIHIQTGEDGVRRWGGGFTQSSPLPAAVFAIYSTFDGFPVGNSGFWSPKTPPPFANCIEVFIASDQETMFGKLCPDCDGYWRTQAAPEHWPMTCPYCGIKAQTYQFLTQGQLDYVKAYCSRFFEVISTAEDSEVVIELDDIADEVGGKSPTNPFYYSETSQQNRFKCNSCGIVNDILGRFGFCSCCGTHNGLQEFLNEMSAIKKGNSSHLELKQAVSAFDSLVAKIAQQLTKKAPMTPKLKDSWCKMSFHRLQDTVNRLKDTFGINLFSAIEQQDQNYTKLCFYRRHIYEHNGGEVDEKYLQESGDTQVKLGQAIRESNESVSRLIALLEQMANNLHKGFHSIFPPESEPISSRKIRK